MLMVPRNRFGFNLFDDMFKDPFFSDHKEVPHMMKTDIKEKDQDYIMDVDLPGYSKEEIVLDLENGYLTVSAHKNENKEEKDSDGKLVYQERYSGSCSRSFYVGDTVKEDDVKASYKDGILHLEFPKVVPQQVETKKRIAIEG